MLQKVISLNIQHYAQPNVANTQRKLCHKLSTEILTTPRNYTDSNQLKPQKSEISIMFPNGIKTVFGPPQVTRLNNIL